MSNQRVFVYRNLHKNLWSVRDCKTGLVIAHEPVVYIDHPTFRVSEIVRDRVRKTGRKEIHAGVEGILLQPWQASLMIKGEGVVWEWDAVEYNPYKQNHFMCVKDTPLSLTFERGQVKWSARFADLDIQSDHKVMVAFSK